MIRGLETDEDRLAAVVEDLASETDRDVDVSVGRSGLLRLAVRVGLAKADAELFERADDAYVANVREDLG